MTALADITAALQDRGPVEPKHKRFVLITEGCMRAVRAEIPEAREPTRFGEVPIVKVEQTDSFVGWTIVDKPLPLRGKFP